MSKQKILLEVRLKKCICIFQFFSLFLFSSVLFQNSAYSQQSPQSQYPMCGGFAPLPEKDNFCPRIEGQHPKGCCPPVVGPQKTCWYAVPDSQDIVVNSSYQSCDENGNTRETDCCEASSRKCYKNIVSRTFISFLNYRSDESKCCFALCPAAVYWANHQQNPGVPPGTHERLGERKPTKCKDDPVDECDHPVNCEASEPCPEKSVCPTGCTNNSVYDPNTKTWPKVCSDCPQPTCPRPEPDCKNNSVKNPDGTWVKKCACKPDCPSGCTNNSVYDPNTKTWPKVCSDCPQPTCPRPEPDCKNNSVKNPDGTWVKKCACKPDCPSGCTNNSVYDPNTKTWPKVCSDCPQPTCPRPEPDCKNNSVKNPDGTWVKKCACKPDCPSGCTNNSVYDPNTKTWPKVCSDCPQPTCPANCENNSVKNPDGTWKKVCRCPSPPPPLPPVVPDPTPPQD